MPKPYSIDLRERVLTACDAGVYTRGEIAQQFDVCEAVIYNWLRRRRQSGSIAAKAHAGGHRSQLDPDVLREIVEQHSDRTLEEYAQLYAERTGRRFHPSWLSRVCLRLRLTRKKRRSAPANSSARMSPQSA
jgi:transposase